jgi:hypothetical protein
MKNRLPPATPAAALAVALLLLIAATACADSFGGPVRREPSGERPAREAPRERAARAEGYRGLTLLRAHAGLSAPSGNFSNDFDTGFAAGLGLAYGVGRDVLLSTDLSYHHFGTSFGSVSMGIVPWTFDADYVIPTTGKVHPWIGGGLGIYSLNVHEDAIVVIGGLPFTASGSVGETNPGMNIEMGLGGTLSPRTDWGAGFRFHHVFEGSRFTDLDFFTFQFGIGFKP